MRGGRQPSQKRGEGGGEDFYLNELECSLSYLQPVQILMNPSGFEAVVGSSATFLKFIKFGLSTLKLKTPSEKLLG